MVPCRLGSSPMMVRNSTDLPPPDVPTTPRSSPLRTSSDRWSSTVWSPKPTTRSLIEMTGLSFTLPPSHPDRSKEDGEQAVEHDHEEDRLHHRRRGLQSERLRAALHQQPFGAGHHPDHQSHERGLDHANFEMAERDSVFQPRNIDLRTHAAIEPSNDTAPVKRGHRSKEGEHRQGDDQH